MGKIIRIPASQIEPLSWSEEYNCQYAVTQFGSKVVIAWLNTRPLTFFREDDFKRRLRNEFFYVGDNKLSKADAWLKWEGRRQFLDPGVIFKPGAPLCEEGRFLNAWRGFGVYPEPGSWSRIQEHIRTAWCNGDEILYKYVFDWMAWVVQNLGEKPQVSLVLRGPQGSGKGVVIRMFGSLFGNHFIQVFNDKYVTGRFNAIIAEAKVIWLDEALFAKDPQQVKTMKGIISEEWHPLERKFIDAIMVESYAAVIISANPEHAAPVEVGDRRYCVFDVPLLHPTHDRGYWGPVVAEAKSEEAQAAMLYDLLHRDLRRVNLRAIPNTEARTKQKVLSFEGTRRWLHQVLIDGYVVIWHPVWHDQRHIYEWLDKDELRLPKDELYEAYVQFVRETERSGRPDAKPQWAAAVRAALTVKEGDGARWWAVDDYRPNTGSRKRELVFASLKDCRDAFAATTGDPLMKWGDEDE
jgi:hypothetical protein